LLATTALSRKCNLRPIDAVGQHKILAGDLATLFEVLSSIHQGVNALVEGNHIHGDPVVGFRGPVVNNPQTNIWLGRMGVAGLGRDETKSAARM